MVSRPVCLLIFNAIIELNTPGTQCLPLDRVFIQFSFFFHQQRTIWHNIFVKQSYISFHYIKVLLISFTEERASLDCVWRWIREGVYERCFGWWGIRWRITHSSTIKFLGMYISLYWSRNRPSTVTNPVRTHFEAEESLNLILLCIIKCL